MTRPEVYDWMMKHMHGRPIDSLSLMEGEIFKAAQRAMIAGFNVTGKSILVHIFTRWLDGPRWHNKQAA